MSKFMRSLWWVVMGVMLIGQVFGQGGATGAINGTVMVSRRTPRVRRTE